MFCEFERKKNVNEINNRIYGILDYIRLYLIKSPVSVLFFFRHASSPNNSYIYVIFVCAGIQKSLRSDFDMAYERGRISVSVEEGNTPPTFTRVSPLQTLEIQTR